VRKVTVEIIMEESGANSIVSDGRNTVSSATSFLANSQRSGVKRMKEKADGSRRSPVMMERARDQIATQNAQKITKKIRAARRV
jgi:predicted sulfurtransferase